MIDPRNPDFLDTPVSASRAGMGYRVDGSVEPIVSIVTPFYNTGPVFRDTARCVLGQSLQTIEWIVVNDASDDEAAVAMLEEFRQRDPRIRVLDLPGNQGPGAARNAGYRAAKADLVFQLDADDLLEPTTLEKCAWFLASHPEYAFVKGYTVSFGAEELLWPRGFHDGERILHENVATITAMVRRQVFLEVGGYDESIRAGFEDWDFWLRCANHGYWGATIPEYLDWYRRRSTHSDDWPDWDQSESQKRFVDRLHQRYPKLYEEGGFVQVQKIWEQPIEDLRAEPYLRNPLAKEAQRILMILPWVRMGGSDKWNLDLVQQLTGRGWEVTIATTIDGTDSWAAEFGRYTPDIWVLDHFVRKVDMPLALRYLIESRTPDVVLLSNSKAGYEFLPYLRAFCPEPTYVDFCHMEEEHWRGGGHPRHGVRMQPQLDLNIVSSNHLRDWMISRGAAPDRVAVSYTNIDPEKWRPEVAVRHQVRQELSLSEELPVVLFAGRLCAQKQTGVLSRVVKELADGEDDFILLIAGYGEDEAEMRAFCAQHHLDSYVRFLGEVPSERVHELMSAADIFFLPSQWEGIAISLFEAMAMQMAAVGAIVGGQIELVTADCGILLPKADEETEVQQFVEAMRPLLNDPERRQLMGQKARARIQQYFTLDKMGDRMLELFERARSMKRTAPRQRIDPALAQELVLQTVELGRLEKLSDLLWKEREELRLEVADLTRNAREVPKPAAEERQLDAESPPLRALSVSSRKARAELEVLEGSVGWRLVGMLKATAAYQGVAKWRWGDGWQAAAEEPWEERLARIQRSKSYRVARVIGWLTPARRPSLFRRASRQ